ncbi:carbohydrate ABC transporter permease [Arthrobacter sp. SA17]
MRGSQSLSRTPAGVLYVPFSHPKQPGTAATANPYCARSGAVREGSRASGPEARRSFLPYGLIMPAVILEILIHIGPMILGVWIAFISLNQLNLTNWLNAPFVGLQNFVNGLNPESTIGQAFFSTVGRTMLYTVTVVGFSWILGMAGAVFLSSNFKGRAILRTFFLVPYALPGLRGHHRLGVYVQPARRRRQPDPRGHPAPLRR